MVPLTVYGIKNIIVALLGNTVSRITVSSAVLQNFIDLS